MSVKLLTEHHLEFLSLKGGCTGWSESTLVKMPHCWKSQSCHGSIIIYGMHSLIRGFFLFFRKLFIHNQAELVQFINCNSSLKLEQSDSDKGPRLMPCSENFPA